MVMMSCEAVLLDCMDASSPFYGLSYSYVTRSMQEHRYIVLRIPSSIERSHTDIESKGPGTLNQHTYTDTREFYAHLITQAPSLRSTHPTARL